MPKGYEPGPFDFEKAKEVNNEQHIKIFNNPYEAVLDSNVLYTDVWSSMGEEQQLNDKDKDFKGFTLDTNLFKKARKDAIVLIGLPAYESKEITDEIMECKRSRIFDQAEIGYMLNR